MTVDVAGLRELLAKATPGPWAVEDAWASSVHSKAENLRPNRVHGYGYGDNGFICDLNDGEYHEYTDGGEQQANAATIAALFNAAPALLDAWEERERLKEALSLMVACRLESRDPHGYNGWSITSLNEALPIARTALQGDQG